MGQGGSTWGPGPAPPAPTPAGGAPPRFLRFRRSDLRVPPATGPSGGGSDLRAPEEGGPLGRGGAQERRGHLEKEGSTWQ